MLINIQQETRVRPQGVVHKGRPQQGGFTQMRTRGEGGFDSMRTCTSQLRTKACHAGMCSCMPILITPTVTALVVLNGLLRLLNVCCLWLLGLWHGANASVKGESSKSHPSLASHSPLAHTLLKCC